MLNLKMAENYYYTLIAELKIHLGMVFHRFLDGSISDYNFKPSYK